MHTRALINDDAAAAAEAGFVCSNFNIRASGAGAAIQSEA